MDARSAFNCKVFLPATQPDRRCKPFTLSRRSIVVTDDRKSARFFVRPIGFLEESVQVGALAFFIDTGGPVDGEANGDDGPAMVIAW